MFLYSINNNRTPLEKILFALKLYLEGMGFRGIARILNVNNTTVLRWVKFIGMSVKTYINTYLPDNPRHVDCIEMDEMTNAHLHSINNRIFRIAALKSTYQNGHYAIWSLCS